MHTSSYWLTIPADVMASLPYGGDDRRDGVDRASPSRCGMWRSCC